MEEQSRPAGRYSSSVMPQRYSSNQGRPTQRFADTARASSRFSEPWNHKVEVGSRAQTTGQQQLETSGCSAVAENCVPSCSARLKCSDSPEASLPALSPTHAAGTAARSGSVAVVDFLTSIGLHNATTIAITLRADAGVCTVEDLLVAVFFGVGMDNAMLAAPGPIAVSSLPSGASASRFRHFLASLDRFKENHSGALHKSTRSASPTIASCVLDSSDASSKGDTSTFNAPSVILSTTTTEVTDVPPSSSLPSSGGASLSGSPPGSQTFVGHAGDVTHATIAVRGAAASAGCHLCDTNSGNGDTQAPASAEQAADSDNSSSAYNASKAEEAKGMVPLHPMETRGGSGPSVIPAGGREGCLKIEGGRTEHDGTLSDPDRVVSRRGTNGGAELVEEASRKQSSVFPRPGKGKEDEQKACVCCRCCLKVGDGFGECLCRYMRSPVLKAVAQKITEEERRVIVLQLVRYARERLTEVEFALLPYNVREATKQLKTRGVSHFSRLASICCTGVDAGGPPESLSFSGRTRCSQQSSENGLPAKCQRDEGRDKPRRASPSSVDPAAERRRLATEWLQEEGGLLPLQAVQVIQAVEQVAEQRARHRIAVALAECSPRQLLGRVDKDIKQVADKIYSSVQFDRWVFDNVIDTPYVQRLRQLKQLGACSMVYPSATHSRFEHSLGVGFLARRFFTKLATKMGFLAGVPSGCSPSCISSPLCLCVSAPSLPLHVTDAHVENSLPWQSKLPQESHRVPGCGTVGCCSACGSWVLGGTASGWQRQIGEVGRLAGCVEIAGLCHDLGHGPFSHSFECGFVNHPDIMRKRSPPQGAARHWSHEEMSLKMVERLTEPLSDVGGERELEEDDLQIIKNMIMGVPPAWMQKGVGGLDPLDSLTRASFDIVANKRNGLDVDRFDYCRRDASILPPSNPLPSISINRLLDYSNVIDSEICFNIKELHTVFNVYYTRFSLFKTVYTHRMVRAMELMLCEAFRLADSTFGWSERINLVDEFLELADERLLYDIRTHPLFTNRSKFVDLDDEERGQLTEAKRLIDLVTRNRRASDIFRFTGEVPLQECDDERVKEIEALATPEHILQFAPTNHFRGSGGVGDGLKLRAEDLVIDWNLNHYGTGSEDPLKVVRFYNPDNEDVSFQASDETRRIYPQCFQERYLRLYCKDNRKLETAKATFQAFCKNFGLTVQCDGTPAIPQTTR
ncbi:metal-dependent phosphohydrolase hd domain-containing protein, partial [Cystoisospora suis]